MTSQLTHLDQLVADMRQAAERHLADFDLKHANAVDFHNQAQRELAAAKVHKCLAAGYAATATALESGVIDINDGRIVAGLRGGLADAQEAIDPRLPVARQREQLAAAEAATFTGAQIDGTACADCGGEIRGTSGGMVVGETTHGPLYEHINAEDCNRHVATEAVKSDAYAAGYRDALDDDARLAEAADFAAAAEPGIEVEL